MEALQVSISTISPIYVPIELKTGIDRGSDAYGEHLASLTTNFANISLSEQTQARLEYADIDQDSWEHRLFIWRNTTLAANLSIHVFPNNIAIVICDHQLDYSGDNKALEQSAQQQTQQLIQLVYTDFVAQLTDICRQQYADYFRLTKPVSTQANVFWVSRALLLESTALSQPEINKLTTAWLAHTYRPEDANDILTGRLNYSMTWLNYIIVDAQPCNDERLDSMVLAQYYYAAQEHCNKLLKQAIDSAYNSGKTVDAQKKLSRSRVNSRLHQVDYHEHLKYLTRSKRQLLEGILSCWNYRQLTRNGQRMIEICSSKIDETENEKRERSSLLTDLLLVALSFFTVFELSLYLTELSREMMSRPTLDFNDDSRSFMLQFIADIDADVMFGSGFLLTLLLVFVYKFIKSR